MRFLVDAQLPPALAEALRSVGSDAIHVADLALQAATDQQIWDEATIRSAVLITKDRDFVTRRVATDHGPTILWVRIGNATNATLIAHLLRAMPKIVVAIARKEAVIEVIRR